MALNSPGRLITFIYENFTEVILYSFFYKENLTISIEQRNICLDFQSTA